MTARLPDLVRPMLATAGELPPAQDEQRWAFEMKWDGVRAMVYSGGGAVRVMTRNDREVAGSYPELARVGDLLGGLPAVVDGEIVALDAGGRPDFGLLQQRMHVVGANQVRALAERVPVAYLAFDVVYLDGRDTLALPYDERRELLDSLGLDGPGIAVPPAFGGNGSAALAASHQRRLEGVVAKRRDSRYEPGRRSRAWVKAKHVRTQEVLIGGWRPGSGSREGKIGSLLVGIPGPAGLRYVGHVGTGFSEAALAELGLQLARLARRTSPFSPQLARTDSRDAVWVAPRLVGEVAFSEWTKDGRLRHPAWRGLRPDKDPEDVVSEP